jgi:hypothetical protein
MICLYINYPNPHFTIHGNAQCAQIRKMGKNNQRIVKVHMKNLNDVLSDFIARKHKFAAMKEVNDLWIEIDLDSPEQEIGFVNTVQALLGRQYGPFKSVKMKKHC